MRIIGTLEKSNKIIIGESTIFRHYQKESSLHPYLKVFQQGKCRKFFWKRCNMVMVLEPLSKEYGQKNTREKP